MVFGEIVDQVICLGMEDVERCEGVWMLWRYGCVEVVEVNGCIKESGGCGGCVWWLGGEWGCRGVWR